MNVHRDCYLLRQAVAPEVMKEAYLVLFLDKVTPSATPSETRTPSKRVDATISIAFDMPQ